MAGALQHRGPQGEGIWVNHKSSIGFAHRRLAIIDLSDAGAQPMQYLHYTIAFNGEIYNYKELKHHLQQHGYSFTTSTDTEVIPAAYDYWGLDCLHRFDGMFAFALHNNKTGITIIARDRFGEKPLYYTQASSYLHATNISGSRNTAFNGLLFASEMKALWAAGVERTLDDSMMLIYLALGFVQHPQNKSKTFYRDIFSLPSGYALQVNEEQRKFDLLNWYDPNKKVAIGTNTMIDEKKAIERFNGLLFESISRRLRSDVPVGSSLSGGIDSSAIVAITNKLLQEHPNKNFSSECFTAVFPGFHSDESSYAKKVAGVFHLKQHIVQPSADDLVKHWQQFMYYQEEPVQSSSVLTQFLVYKLAKENNITVLLDGQGADEILGGYKKYSHWYLQQLLFTNPLKFIREKSLLNQNMFLEVWDLKNYLAAVSPSFTAGRLRKRTKREFESNPFFNHEYRNANADESVFGKPLVNKVDQLMFYNTFRFGLEELLRYADRNSMAHSREVRLPFLFHELVEFVFSLPSHYKIRNGFTKWILRESIQTILPGDITWRKNKVGYEPPQQEWMQTAAIQQMVLQSRQRLVNEKILNAKIMDEPILAKTAHASGNYDWRYLNAAAIMNG